MGRIKDRSERYLIVDFILAELSAGSELIEDQCCVADYESAADDVVLYSVLPYRHT